MKIHFVRNNFFVIPIRKGLPKITEKIHEGLSWPLNDLFRESLERQNSKFTVTVLSKRFLSFPYRLSAFIQRF